MSSVSHSVKVLQCSSAKFLTAIEIVVSKHQNVESLKAALTESFKDELKGEFDYLQIAKGLSNGPPLKASDAAKSLKWDDPKWAADIECPLSRAPVSLRDGSLLYLRSFLDSELAAASLGPIKVATKIKESKSWRESSAVKANSSRRHEPSLRIGVHREESSIKEPNSPRSKLASAMKVSMEAAACALDAAGGDENLALEFIRSEVV